MNSNNQNAQNYYNLPMNNLPMDQTGNSFAPQQFSNNDSNENTQHSLINNVGVFNPNLNTSHISTINSPTPAPQNEFYLLSDDTVDARIYHVTYQYTELHPLENVRLLNDRINLSHTPNHQIPRHNINIQSLIQQHIQQQVQQPVYYQQNSIQQQSFDTIQPSQVYSNNNTYDTTSISVNGTASYDMQDMGNTSFQNSS
jgi:hypothetical protein